MNTTAILLLCLGGALGAVSRYWLTRLGGLLAPDTHFPLPTLFINISGSALLGLVFGLMEPDFTALIDSPIILFFGVGFCGAYTTFSSFCTETVALIPQSAAKAGLYIFSTIIGSIAAFVAVFHLLA